MKALKFDKTLQLVDVPPPERLAGEALIHVQMAGICNTDLEIIKGYMGFRGILGHEFVGRVEEASNADWVGQRVVGEINIACGKCEFCKIGLERHCRNRTVLGIQGKDGAFAEYLTLPERNLHKVPETISDQEAVFVEPLAASLEILEQVKIEPSAKVAVIGDGKLGLLITQVLIRTGVELVVVGKSPHKLAIAETFGAATAQVDSPPEQMFDYVVEVSGSPQGFELALALLKPRGTMVLKSTFHQNLTFNSSKIVIDEINIVGSRCGLFAPAIRHLEQKWINVKPLISNIFSFANAQSAFKVASEADRLKVLLDFRNL